MTDPGSLTTLLHAWRAGDGAAFEKVIESAHAELSRMAAGRLRGENALVTLMPTELLHEAIARVMESPPKLENRADCTADSECASGICLTSTMKCQTNIVLTAESSLCVNL